MKIPNPGSAFVSPCRRKNATLWLTSNELQGVPVKLDGALPFFDARGLERLTLEQRHPPEGRGGLLDQCHQYLEHEISRQFGEHLVIDQDIAGEMLLAACPASIEQLHRQAGLHLLEDLFVPITKLLVIVSFFDATGDFAPAGITELHLRADLRLAFDPATGVHVCGYHAMTGATTGH